MRVLLVSTHDKKGGAARAAYRLHCALQAAEVDSQMLVYQRRQQHDSTVRTTAQVGGRFAQQTIRFSQWLERRKIRSLQPGGVFSLNLYPNRLAQQINRLQPDVVHLHWVGAGFLPISALAQIRAPLAWTLHDMWAFTGGCHYTGACRRFEQHCGDCPQIKHPHESDISAQVLQHKHKHWRNVPLHVITPSQWLASEARRSALLRAAPIHVLPNTIDVQRYKPIDRAAARELLNLPQDKRLLLFGALNSTSDPRKGFAYLQQAITQLAGQRDDVELVVFGAHGSPDESPLPAHYLGTLSDAASLVAAYAAADAFIAPSTQENLANGVMEALACGLPVVAFRIGGMPDLIDHQQNGYLAAAYDVDDLARGVQWVLQHEQPATLRQAARQSVLDKYAPEVVVPQHVALYERLLAGDGGRAPGDAI